MSRLFTIAIVAALLVVPSSVAVRADEASSETKQACDKEKCCKEGNCKKDCKEGECKESCKEGKCEKECCKDGKCKDGSCKEGCDKKECCKDACKEGCDKKQCSKEGCDKEKCCKDSCEKKECCKEGDCKEACKGECESKTAKCTKCKCESCDNAQCDSENCQCVASKTCASKCEGAACCDQTAEVGGIDFRALTLVAAGIQSECASGKCCKSNCSDKACCKEGKNCCDAAKCVAGECCSEGACCEEGFAGCIDSSALHWGGNSIFAVTVPSPTTVETIDTLRWAARDWAIRCSDDTCEQAQQESCVTAASISENGTGTIAATYTQPVSRWTNVTSRCSATESVQSPGAVQYSIQIVEDCGDCFKEFEWQANGGNQPFLETKSLAPTIRTLEKHQLIRRVSPKITCTSGQQAALEVNSGTEEEPKQLKVQVVSRVIENDQQVVELYRSGDNQQRGWVMAVSPEPGKSFVINTAGPVAGSEEDQANQPAVFIVVTSEAAK